LNCSVLSPTRTPESPTSPPSCSLPSLLVRRTDIAGVLAHELLDPPVVLGQRGRRTALAGAERAAAEPSRMSAPGSRACEVVNSRTRGRSGSEDMAAVLEVRLSCLAQYALVDVVPTFFQGISHRTLAICTSVFMPRPRSMRDLVTTMEGAYHAIRAAPVQSDSEALCKYSGICSCSDIPLNVAPP
jgi:hypothetical protein